MDKINIKDVKPFITKDGSEIRELLAWRNSKIKNQSLAEAIVYPGQSTIEHYHNKSEEIYFVESGEGLIQLNNEKFEIQTGDAIAIPPRTKHKLWNTGTSPLKILCCCAPAYEHEDTVLIDLDNKQLNLQNEF